jgi:hypothetical protein
VASLSSIPRGPPPSPAWLGVGRQHATAWYPWNVCLRKRSALVVATR